ncbi:ORF9 similar to AcMNPV ORF145 [Cydia pomonella granulovirus]|uniref:ORF9 n=2 Tax=Cydia pomonella granulosis virus TaxID=28289 RepID=A0A097P271_GVCP|nr:ORF9 similar to AcMNPV ORF145 [Cydia pomonella granulovirus]AAK70676.1 ORF9 similar to AcMNPV ORF145 [Cydia pomonella granulovirus]AIU36658.1 ORF9 [Cydia pomonella granulovirus]AIU36798.1 ORF9 [Cydia pomonella granulovirus]AIU36935.1 ORF9 [Cydia pomonella granulovirus]AIU37077.1 ORF9 [Cydia pomonella granulovirus]
MDLLNFSTFIFLVFIIIKVIIYYGIKNLQKQTWVKDRVCVNGYYGSVADPFECDSYFKCPEGIKFYCDVGEQFDGDRAVCVPLTSNDVNSCVETASRRLLD